MQDNPILIEVTRGGLVESCHRGAVAIADADGRVLLGLGDIERPVYPRSAVKALQAIPLVESGAAEAFGLRQAELAITCASHSGDETLSARCVRCSPRRGSTSRSLPAARIGRSATGRRAS